MGERTRWLRWAGAGALLAWCLVAAVSALLTAVRQPRDPMAELEASFLPFALDLPAHGEVGFLEAPGGGDEAARAYYAAQYALVPRVVVGRVGPEFLIVPSGAEPADADGRLDGYYPVTRLPNGHRLYRRLLP